MLYLVSIAGHPNYGDELIARSWLEYLAKRCPDEEVWLDCPHPGTAALLLQGIHSRAHFTDTLWRLCWQFPLEGDPKAFIASIRSSVREFGSPLVDAGLSKLREAESIHLLGGGYINDLWPHHAGLLAALGEVKNLTGARIFATGISLAPVPSVMGLLDSLKEFDYVSVRDSPSLSVPGTVFGLDDAFLGVERELERSAETRAADVVVCIQEDLAHPDAFEGAVDFARMTLGWARRERKSVQYVEALPGSDRAGFERLRDLISEDEFRPFLDIWKNGLGLNAGQFWVTTRFHLHFLAAAAGASGTAFDIAPRYYDVKHGLLRSQGSGWGKGQEDRATLLATSNSFVSELPARVAAKRAEADSLYDPPIRSAPTHSHQGRLARLGSMLDSLRGPRA